MNTFIQIRKILRFHSVIIFLLLVNSASSASRIVLAQEIPSTDFPETISSSHLQESTITLPPQSVTVTPTPNITGTISVIQSDILTQIAPTNDSQHPNSNVTATVTTSNDQSIAILREQGSKQNLVYISLIVSFVALAISIVGLAKNFSGTKNISPGDTTEQPDDVNDNIPWKNIVVIIFSILPIIGLILGFIIYTSSIK